MIMPSRSYRIRIRSHHQAGPALDKHSFAIFVWRGFTRRPHSFDADRPYFPPRRGRAPLWRLVLSASVLWILLGSIPAKADMPLVLADPSLPLASAWEHRSFGESTDYSADVVDGIAAIRAEGRISASGLFRRVHYSVRDHPWLEWSWRVDAMQRTADIRLKERQDFAAAVFLIFGQPSVLRRNVPTLAYVWTSAGMLTGEVVESPRRKDVIRFIVIESGHEHLGRWMHERRNVIRDFRKAFGREPPEEVELIAVFTDNDQTKEPVEAYYGAIRAYSARSSP